MKRSVFLLFLLLPLFFLHAQTRAEYHPIQAEGLIPETILVPSSEKYKKEVAEALADMETDKKREDAQKRFSLNSNFAMDDLLKSGLVLFNDPISSYLNAIKAILTAEHPELAGKVEIYALRSSAVNAFANNRGEILVTLGLLARMENEAQLAYILSHELAHVDKKHVQELYWRTQEIEGAASQQEILRRGNFDDAILEKNRYSRELETEADLLGLDFFLQTSYRADSLPAVFTILKNAHLPYQNTNVDLAWFGPDAYRFFEILNHKDTVAPDTGDSFFVRVYESKQKSSDTLKTEEEDLNATHPGAAKRQQTIRDALDKKQAQGGEEFLISQDQFLELRRLARLELPMMYLHQDRFDEAIYYSYLLLQEDPYNIYLEKIVAKSLHVLAKYKNESDVEQEVKMSEVARKQKGGIGPLARTLAKLKGPEMTALALGHVWNLHTKYPEDEEITAITKDLFIEINQHVTSMDGFKNESENDSTPQQWKQIFSALHLADPAFEEGYMAGQEEYKKREKLIEYYKTTKGRREYMVYEDEKERRGFRLGVKRIVVVNPSYLKVDERNDYAVDYIGKELGQSELSACIQEVTPLAKIDAEVLDVETLSASDVEKFNDIRLLNEWIAEQANHSDISLTSGYRQQEINALADKYGTDYFLWTGVVSVREKEFAVLKLYLGTILWPYLPIVLADLTQTQKTVVYGILFNVRTGQREVLRYKEYKQNTTPSVMRGHYYDILNQIRSEDK